jgi:hypothetical protein
MVLQDLTKWKKSSVVEAHFPLKIRAGLGKGLWPYPSPIHNLFARSISSALGEKGTLISGNRNWISI